jgi:hypothetical protein
VPICYDDYNDKFHALILAACRNAELSSLLNHVKVLIMRLQFNRLLLHPDQMEVHAQIMSRSWRELSTEMATRRRPPCANIFGIRQNAFFVREKLFRLIAFQTFNSSATHVAPLFERRFSDAASLVGAYKRPATAAVVKATPPQFFNLSLKLSPA